MTTLVGREDLAGQLAGKKKIEIDRAILLSLLDAADNHVELVDLVARVLDEIEVCDGH